MRNIVASFAVYVFLFKSNFNRSRVILGDSGADSRGKGKSKRAKEMVTKKSIVGREDTSPIKITV